MKRNSHCGLFSNSTIKYKLVKQYSDESTIGEKPTKIYGYFKSNKKINVNNQNGYCHVCNSRTCDSPIVKKINKTNKMDLVSYYL